MIRNLPDAHELKLEEVDGLINLSLDLKDKVMFKEYLLLKESMIAENVVSVWIDTYTGDLELFLITDNINRINELTKSEILQLMRLSVDLDDKAMFEEYSELLDKMKREGYTKLYRATYEDPHYNPSNPFQDDFEADSF